MKQILQTERLILREFIIEDAQKMYELNSDFEVIKYAGDPAFDSVEQAKKFLENYSDYKRNGYGRWAVITKDTNEFIGWCGLKFNEENMVDIGFRFFRNVWNKGYATESAKAVLDYGFNSLMMNQIIARASSRNNASIRVLEKLSMNFWKIDDCEGIENSKYYRINTN